MEKGKFKIAFVKYEGPPTVYREPDARVEVEIPEGWGGVDEPWCTWKSRYSASIWRVAPNRFRMLVEHGQSEVVCKDFKKKEVSVKSPWMPVKTFMVDAEVEKGELTAKKLAELLKSFMEDYRVSLTEMTKFEGPFIDYLTTAMVGAMPTNYLQVEVEDEKAEIKGHPMLEGTFKLGEAEDTEEWIKELEERAEEIEVYERLPTEAKLKALEKSIEEELWGEEGE